MKNSNHDGMWNDWLLSDLLSIKHGYAFDGKYFTTSGQFVLLTPGNFYDAGGFKHKEQEKYFVGEVDEQYILKRGDLLVAMTEQAEGLLGSSALIPESGKYLHNQRLGLVIDLREHRIDKRFLYYLFNTRGVRTQIRASASGTKVRHTAPSRIGEVKVHIPGVATQRKIAAVVSAYDDLIENNTRRIAILEEMAQDLYREWFVRFRFPGHENVPLVPSPLGDIPQGWNIRPLYELCSRITDGSHRSPKSVEEGLPMASMKDMTDWGLDLSACRYISEEDFNDLVRNECKPRVGDVLIAKDGASYLKYIFVVEKELEVVLLSSVAILRPSDGIEPHLLTFILRDPSIKARLANYVTGAAIPRVILKDFARFQIAVPPRPMQTAWWEMCQPIVGLIHRLRDKCVNLRKTRDLLLPKLISGQLDVEHLDIDAGEPLTVSQRG